ncbi:MAG: hypothetical protein K9L64_00045 [Candidatus Izimaplasma sp.]|nr:hypothetical protein [Candidatus Izimaplasma bacterium]
MRLTKIQIMSFIIAFLAFIAALVGVLAFGDYEEISFITIRGEEVFLYGKGIYAFDTVSVALQAIAQDFVTLVIAIPLLIYSTIKLTTNSVRWTLLHLGMVGYFLYSYGTYSFLSHFNALFLVYVIIFSMSFFTFVLAIMRIDVEKIKISFKEDFSKKLIVIFLLFTGFMLLAMWLGRIGPALLLNEIPVGLESYSTLVIQVFDLGFIVPLSFLGAYLLANDKAWGYLLAGVLLLKGIALFTAVSAMGIMQLALDEGANIVEISIFLALTLFSFYVIFKFITGIKKTSLI